MGRKTRTIATHALYHVTARGNNREALFLSDKDRETYLGLWRKYRTELEFHVYAYVLMTNHVHWLIRTGRVPISSIVHTIHFNITVEELLGDSRAPTHVQARKQFIKEAVRQHAYKRAEVARFLKKDRSLVTKVLQGES